MITDLNIGEGLPIRIIESRGFVNFLKVLHPQYKPPCRKTVRKKILKKADNLESKIADQFKECHSVNVTVDMWSDRKLRSFLGVTAHVIVDENDSLQLKSFTLACEQFSGRHSGENISAAFEKITQRYGIRNKITYIITDNAANMKKAFTTCFPSLEEEIPTLTESAGASSNPSASHNFDQESDDDNCEPSMSPLEAADQEEVDAELENITNNSRLACFAHSLQLVIRDGINHSKSKYTVT